MMVGGGVHPLTKLGTLLVFVNRMTNRYRHSMRLYDHDYGAPGYYFVTICTDGKINFFGNLKDKRVILSEVSHMI